MRTKINEGIYGMKINTPVTLPTIFACLLLLVGLWACRSMTPRDSAIAQIQAAEQTLQQANTAEAHIYVLEEYLKARMLLRRARSSMREEEYNESYDFAQRSQEVALEAIQQTDDEQESVKEISVRLLFSADEAWESYAHSYEKEYVSEELIEIRKILDKAQEEINTQEYMDGFKTVQRAHEKIAELPEAIGKQI